MATVSEHCPSLWVSKWIWIDFIKSIFDLLDFSVSDCNDSLICLLVFIRIFLTLWHCESLALQPFISHKGIYIFSFPLLAQVKILPDILVPLCYTSIISILCQNWLKAAELSSASGLVTTKQKITVGLWFCSWAMTACRSRASAA